MILKDACGGTTVLSWPTCAKSRTHTDTRTRTHVRRYTVIRINGYTYIICRGSSIQHVSGLTHIAKGERRGERVRRRQIFYSCTPETVKLSGLSRPARLDLRDLLIAFRLEHSSLHPLATTIHPRRGVFLFFLCFGFSLLSLFFFFFLAHLFHRIPSNLGYTPAATSSITLVRRPVKYSYFFFRQYLYPPARLVPTGII